MPPVSALRIEMEESVPPAVPPAEKEMEESVPPAFPLAEKEMKLKILSHFKGDFTGFYGAYCLKRGLSVDSDFETLFLDGNVTSCRLNFSSDSACLPALLFLGQNK